MNLRKAFKILNDAGVTFCLANFVVFLVIEPWVSVFTLAALLLSVFARYVHLTYGDNKTDAPKFAKFFLPYPQLPLQASGVSNFLAGMLSGSYLGWMIAYGFGIGNIILAKRLEKSTGLPFMPDEKDTSTRATILRKLHRGMAGLFFRLLTNVPILYSIGYIATGALATNQYTGGWQVIIGTLTIIVSFAIVAYTSTFKVSFNPGITQSFIALGSAINCIIALHYSLYLPALNCFLTFIGESQVSWAEHQSYQSRKHSIRQKNSTAEN